jgi:hypothetical protein
MINKKFSACILTDPMTRRIIQTMENMGFKSDVAKLAVMAVKNQTSGMHNL